MLPSPDLAECYTGMPLSPAILGAMDMDWQTLVTVVPTALSASLYSMTQLTFSSAMRRDSSTDSRTADGLTRS